MPYANTSTLFTLIFTIFSILSTTPTYAAETPFTEVTFKTPDGGTCHANLYTPNPGVKTDAPDSQKKTPGAGANSGANSGVHAVILAHGAVFNKESWHDLSIKIAAQGLIALPIDFRGYGQSTPGSKKSARELDILGAINYLQSQPHIKQISLIGASMGGGASATAAVLSKPNDLHKLILLAAVPIKNPQYMKGDKLFIVSKGDRLHKAVTQQFNQAKPPKKLVTLPGSAHAQHIFKTEHAQQLTDLIIQTLTAK